MHGALHFIFRGTFQFTLAFLSVFLDLVFIPPIEEILLTAKNITKLSTIRKKNNERITVAEKK